MTPSEVALVLSKAASYDRRTLGEADVAAWYEAIDDLALDTALAAVARHYRQTTEWLMPADVRRHAADIRREQGRQLRRSPVLALPSRYETDEERNLRIKRGVAACRAALDRGDVA
jgi:hypothetical protein